MTTKSEKTTKAADDTTLGTEAAVGPATGGTRPRPGTKSAKSSKRRQGPASTAGEAMSPRKTRTDTKQAKLIAMLKAKDGATVEEIAAAFAWQAHTVRGALYGALKKKLGLNVTSETVEGKGRVYRIGSIG